jgi:RNA polymerase sigma-70 factor (ECF subfamily)
MGSDLTAALVNALSHESAQTSRNGPIVARPSRPVPTDLLTADSCETDESLMSQVGSGSRDALGLLFRKHGRSVLSVASRILRDQAEADDLRQEIFLYIFQKATQFDPKKGSAVSWIIQVTYHRAIDRRRYLDLRQHYRSESLFEERISIQFGHLSTDSIDGRAILRRVKEQLTDDQQKTLELHFFEGYSLSEIAALRGLTVGNVRHHYYRALERLRLSVFSKERA